MLHLFKIILLHLGYSNLLVETGQRVFFCAQNFLIELFAGAQPRVNNLHICGAA